MHIFIPSSPKNINFDEIVALYTKTPYSQRHPLDDDKISLTHFWSNIVDPIFPMRHNSCSVKIKFFTLL